MRGKVTQHLSRTHPYDDLLALKICEEIARGALLKELVEQEDMPTITTVYRWLSVYPAFFDAYQRAKELSAQSFEEEALEMARTLKGPNDFNSTKVQAYNVAMQQLRWSAARRNPAIYGQKGLEGGGKVQVTIATSLNIAQDGRPATEEAKSVYTIEFGGPGTSNEQPETLDLEAEPSDTDDQNAFGVPVKPDHNFRKGKGGRPPGSHKGVAGRRKPAAKVKEAATRKAAILARLTGEKDT